MCTPPMRDVGSGDDSEEPLDPSESTQILGTAFNEKTRIQSIPVLLSALNIVLVGIGADRDVLSREPASIGSPLASLVFLGLGSSTSLLSPAMGPFTVGQRSDANDLFLRLSVTDAEFKAINETFMKYGWTNEEETPSLTDRYGRRGAVSEQGSSSKGGQPANVFGNRKATEMVNFKERFEEVFGAKGRVSIEMLQEHQKKRLVAERVRNEKLAAEEEKKVSEPVTGNTGLFPYPAHGNSESEVTQELLVGPLSSLVRTLRIKTPSKTWPPGRKESQVPIKLSRGIRLQRGKSRTGSAAITLASLTNLSVIGAVKLEQTAAGGASNTGVSLNNSARKDLTTKDEQSVGLGQASNAPDNVIFFGPTKPPVCPDHIPPRQHLRPLKPFAPFENDQPKDLSSTLRPDMSADPRAFWNLQRIRFLPHQLTNPRLGNLMTPSPFAALEQALGTTRFTQGVPEPFHLTAPKPPSGAKPTGGLITDATNGFIRVNYGGRQTQLDPDGRGLSRSEFLKHKQRPGALLGITFKGPKGMEFDIDKIDFNPAGRNALGSKFKPKSQLRMEQEALRDQQSQQPQHPQAGGAQQATPVKGIPVQGKGSAAGSGTRSISDIPPGVNPQPSPSATGNWAARQHRA
ncbi:hypothetical protein HOY82DRAFT_669428 [Tuber indicum]|nr:hypothetical protein HOY82DRAFT_669428 [Tuber indicum]